eukprot:1161760-Pelagomonas_calceolata.AAC.3
MHAAGIVLRSLFFSFPLWKCLHTKGIRGCEWGTVLMGNSGVAIGVLSVGAAVTTGAARGAHLKCGNSGCE